MTDEFQLRDLARELAGHYQQLQALKGAQPQRPEARTMVPAPGPRTPGNWLALNMWVEQEQRLREVCLNAFGRDGIQVRLRADEFDAITLCNKLAYHAAAIAELDWADDLADELEHQARAINQLCNPPTATTLKRAERIKTHLADKYAPPLDN